MSWRERRWHRYVLWVSAFAWALLTDLARDSFAQNLLGGVIGRVAFVVIAALALYWLVSNLPQGWQRIRRRLARKRGEHPVPPAAPTELQSYAEQAERWLFDFGSDGGGMAAADWFRRNEMGLRRLLAETDVRPDTVDQLAWICDALETGYIRGRRVAELLELSDQLAKIGERAGRRDLEELAAVRAATAYRLTGNLNEATSRLGVASSLAPRGRTAAAMRARRELERGLIHLARADRQAPGTGRTDAVLSARDRFDDAGLIIPRADLAADIAIHLNIAVVHLYQHDANKALDHLRLARARASASRDASAQAHALELTGVAAWLQGNRPQAIRCWHEARHRYADVAEPEGEARCLQHLGSAALVGGQLTEAGRLLERSAQLRPGSRHHEVLEHYRTRLARSTGPAAGPALRPERSGLVDVLRRLWRRLRS